MVHACRATSAVEYASSEPFVRRTVLGSGTGQSTLPWGVARTLRKPSLPFPHHYDCKKPYQMQVKNNVLSRN